eukprot:4462986-Pleurochrysis_carterae.AAC.1
MAQTCACDLHLRLHAGVCSPCDLLPCLPRRGMTQGLPASSSIGRPPRASAAPPSIAPRAGTGTCVCRPSRAQTAPRRYGLQQSRQTAYNAAHVKGQLQIA